ncbi:MAG: (d)CMP kinase [Candidatus Neomarinimicrobiota bacterium]
MIIAIDGPSASGKSTTAKGVSERLNFTHLDTGAMYRAVTLGLSNENISLNDNKLIIQFLDSIKIYFDEKNCVWLNGKDVSQEIRTVDISSKVSMVSANIIVRKKMVIIQRLIASDTNCVLEGRDIGSVVFPNADYKFFLDADIQIRAQRRFEELKKNDVSITMAEIISSIKKRDELDSTREHSPLLKAKDAINIDTTHITINEQIEKIVAIVNNK